MLAPYVKDRVNVMQQYSQAEKLFATTVLLFTTLLQTACASGLERYSLSKQSGIDFVELSNSVHAIKIPTNQLTNAKIISLDGLMVLFSQEKHLSFSVSSRESFGVPDMQFLLSNIPEYLIGKKPLPEQQAEAYRIFYEDLALTRKVLIEDMVTPIKIGYFVIPDGKIYIAIGKKQAVIFVYTSEFPDIISQLSVHGLSVKEIESMILQGYVQ